MGQWLVVVLSLGSAAAFALAASLKHRSAGEVPDAQNLRPTAVGQFVRATVVHRLWLAGIAADAVAVLLQIVALHYGALAVVQPLLISGLLFALLLRPLHHQPIGQRELGWALVVSAALVGFVALAGTAGRSSTHAGVDRVPAIVAGIVGLVLATGCVAVAHRQRPGGISAALLGVAVGITYAAAAALLKAVGEVAVHGPRALLTSWQLYTVLVIGVLGLLLNQLAFQAGPLTASLPAIATVNPLASIAIGVLVYDEAVRHSPEASLGLALLLLVLGIAVIQLTRSGGQPMPSAR
jgi:hypothetical protein